MAYDLTLSPRLSVVYPVFHVSMHFSYIPFESYVISYDSINLVSNLTYAEELISILDRHVWRLRTKESSFCSGINQLRRQLGG